MSCSAFALADNADSVKTKKSDYLPKVSGTIRGKMEYQTNEKESRFEVRTARVALDGFVTPIVNYKAEIDLSDEGQIKMLDAYAGVLPTKGVALRIGQMRVPFSIDAHRSPHKQYFANRSFIAKQVGNVRDVGVYGSYTFDKVPLVIEAGAFNGSGLTNQKNYWTKEFNSYPVASHWRLPYKRFHLTAFIHIYTMEALPFTATVGHSRPNICANTIRARRLTT